MTRARAVIAAPLRSALRGVASTSPGSRVLGRAVIELQRAMHSPAPSHESPRSQTSNALLYASEENRERWDTSERATPYATPDNPALDRLNRLCDIADWRNPALIAAMRRQLPYYVEMHPDYPQALEHRKHWEFAFFVVGLEQLGALTPESVVLGVGAGHEEPLYDLTTRAGQVHATDIYGSGSFSLLEADSRMLLDPDHFAVCPYNRRRLVVSYMSALDLRFEDGTIDVAYSLSSIEHFGGVEGARSGLLEMGRVLKPGGVLALTTECIVNGAPHLSLPGLDLFTPEQLRDLVSSLPGLRLVDELSFDLSDATRACPVRQLETATRDAVERGHIDYPQVLLEQDGRVYTSLSVFLRREG